MNEQLFINNAEKIIPPVNDSPYKRILAIGDVHGALDKLESLLEKISPTADDLVIFLGDYFYFAEIKRKNLETLLRLAELSERKNFIFLTGNTDETAMEVFTCEPEVALKMFIRYFFRNQPELVKAHVQNVPKIFYDFMTGLKPSHLVTIGGRKYFFCHAGIKFDKPLELQNKDYVVGNLGCASFYRNYAGEDLIVVGHKSPNKLSEQFDGNKPLKVPGKNILMLDTRAKKKDGKLSCVDLLSGEFWQDDC